MEDRGWRRAFGGLILLPSDALIVRGVVEWCLESVVGNRAGEFFCAIESGRRFIL
jgi:hypothetical protein